ncbi:MAG: hypothetical protein IT562_02895 [Alphaproteobacteria bacterium]|nr:hypothetical protein [Alphaproteobacteria bacterium]
MISLVLYGRNDNYGYNLHKRAAISLNCMAELLDDPEDEILFVDYNTPDDMPTFVEAILDTLTDRARGMIRVLRARPSVHERWRGKTHLNALEPQARNIAIRRSNPKNRWILSTNTDMVFVMRDGTKSLSAAVKDLPRGDYGIPRFEMPESLWESLDRKDPRAVIDAFARWGKALHLDEVVHSHKSILYDAPGDFQLVPRADLIKIHGFSEAMLRGWHVDSNLAKRCLLLYGETKSLFHKVAGYHCDHTKVVTPMHGHDRQQNDMVEHISEVRRPEMPQQADSWGAPDAAIEEIRVPPGRDIGFAAALTPILGPMPKPVYEALYTEKSWNQITYPARHVIPYLADQIATFPRDIDLGYAGLNDTTRALLAETWRALGFTGRLLVHRDTAGIKPGCEPAPDSDAPFVVADLDYMVERAALFVLDLGVEEGPGWKNKIFSLEYNPKAKPLLPFVKAVQAAGFKIAAAERRRMAERRPARRIVLVNTIATELLGQVDTIVGQTVTPYCTHVRHGTIKPDTIDVLRQRRADADRLEQSAAKHLMTEAEKWLPVDMLDQAEPHRLLGDEQRAKVAEDAPKRKSTDAWHDVAVLSLTKLTGDFDQRLAEFLALDPENPQPFVAHLALLRVAAAEVMSRPWAPQSAEAILRACEGFLEQAGRMPDEPVGQAVSTMLALCRGAAGESLDALAERVVAYAGERLAGGDSADPFAAWIALCVADFAIARGPWRSDERALADLRTRLVLPALRRLQRPAPAAQAPADNGRIAILASAPFGRSVDPGAERLSEVFAAIAGSGASQPQVRVFPLHTPDSAFLALARSRGAEVTEAPDQGGLTANHVARRFEALRDAILAWSPRLSLCVGESALALAPLALGTAPVQGVYGSRLTGPDLPGMQLLPDRAALARLILGAGTAQPAKGGAVGVAAR